MKRRTAYIALGANLADRAANLREALYMLARHEGIDVVKVSDFIETDPQGGPEGQPKYINASACIETSLRPRELMQTLLEIEKSIGRNRENEERWGARVCDLDLLLYADKVIDEQGLVVPHPRMHLRMFVLEPLCKIAPHAVHPVLKKTIKQMLEDLCPQN